MSAPTSTAAPDCLAAALDYLARGWTPIPVCSPDGSGGCREHPRKMRGHDGPGKVSLTRWRAWVTCKPTETDVRRFWRRWQTANLALLAGRPSGFVAFDADDTAACAFLGRFDAPRIVTGRGEHALFALPAELSIGNATKLGGMALDLRGDGGYIVAPPSLHANGRRYQWAAGRPPTSAELLPIPCGLVELLHLAPRASEPAAVDREPVRRYRLRPELLAAALRQPGAERLPSGGVRIRCPHDDHGDAHPSAELHGDGSVSCYSHPGGAMTWPPHDWTRWPKAAWAAAVESPKATRPGTFKVPDNLLRAAWATTPTPMLARRERGDTLTIGGKAIRDPIDLARAVRRRCGRDAPRVLVYLTEAMQRQADDPRLRGIFRPRYGEVWWSAKDARPVLGFSDNIGGGRLDDLDRTVRALGTVRAGFCISFERDGQTMTRTFRGPLVGDTQMEVEDRLPDGYTRRGRVVRLHEAIAYGERFGQCYADLPLGILRLHDVPTFLAGLVLARELRRWCGVLTMPLREVLAAAGVPAGSLRPGRGGNPGRILDHWRARLDALAEAGLFADVNLDNTGTVRARLARQTAILDRPSAILAQPSARPPVSHAGEGPSLHVDHVVTRPCLPAPSVPAAAGSDAPVAVCANEAARPERTPAPTTTTRIQATVPGSGVAPLPVEVLDRLDSERRRQAETERRAECERERERNQRDAEQAARRQLPIAAGGATR